MSGWHLEIWGWTEENQACGASLKADLMEEVDELDKDGKDKEKAALWDPIKGLWRKYEPLHQ